MTKINKQLIFYIFATILVASNLMNCIRPRNGRGDYSRDVWQKLRRIRSIMEVRPVEFKAGSVPRGFSVSGGSNLHLSSKIMIGSPLDTKNQASFPTSQSMKTSYDTKSSI